MANEIIITVPVTTWTISAVLVRRTDGATWNVNTSSWDATQTAARAQYRILLAQSGSYNMFTASMPSVSAGLYRVAYYREVGGNYLPVAEDILQWDGATVIITPAADVQAGMTAQNYTTTRAGYLDVLNGLVAAIWAVAMTDIASVPTITASVKDAINWLFVLGRNKRTQTATTETVFKDDGTTTAATSTKSDDGSVFTRGKYS